MEKEDQEVLLSRTEIEIMLDNAVKSGFLSYMAWGGEPFMREDTPAILAHSHKLDLFTSITTNGSLIEQRWKEFIPHVDLFLISLDSVGANHDKVRNVPGLFDKIVNGIDILRSNGARIRLFSIVTKATADHVEEIAKLAKNYRISVYYYPMVRFKGYNDHLVLDAESQFNVFDRILNLKKSGFPIVNLGFYLESMRDRSKIICHYPKFGIFVDYDGTLYTCDLGPRNPQHVWGNVRTIDFPNLFDSQKFKGKAKQLESCNLCRTACGEFGGGHPLKQFTARFWNKLRHEWIFQQTYP